MQANRWHRLKGRTEAYVDASGKILGIVEESLTRGWWRAFHGEDKMLGTYVSAAEAQRAVEVAVSIPVQPLAPFVLPESTAGFPS